MPIIKPKKIGPRGGTAAIWPSGVQARYGISAPTRWRWEKDGRLPKRDINVGGKTGWKPETLAAAETVKEGRSIAARSLPAQQK